MSFQGRVVTGFGVFVVATCWTVPHGNSAVLLFILGLILIVAGLLVAKNPAG